jgi:hypothetical protein
MKIKFHNKEQDLEISDVLYISKTAIGMLSRPVSRIRKMVIAVVPVVAGK